MRYQILNQNRDFLRMYRRAQNKVHPLLVTYVAKNRHNQNRVGITASKKVGCAVKRNRAKRVIRAAFRNLQKTPQGYDIVFVARARTTQCKMQDVQAVMQQHIDCLTER